MKKLLLFVALALAAASSSAAALPTLSVPTALQCTEGGTVGLKVTRTGDKTTTATFRYATANVTAVAPADYTAMSGQQSVRKNAASYSFTLRCGADNVTYSGNRTFTFKITPVSGATVSQGLTTVTVLENDPVPPPPPPPPPPPATQTCGDGVVIPLTQICTVPPTPCPAGTQWNLQTGHCETVTTPPPPPPPPPVVCPDGSTPAPGQACPEPPGTLWIATTLGTSPYARATKNCSSIYRSAETDRVGIYFNGVTAGTIYKLPLGGPGSFPNPSSYNAGWSWEIDVNIDGQTGNSWTVLDALGDSGWWAVVAVGCLEGVRQG